MLYATIFCTKKKLAKFPFLCYNMPMQTNPCFNNLPEFPKNLTAASIIAYVEDVLMAVGLKEHYWCFGMFKRSRRILGTCDCRNLTINLSETFFVSCVELNAREELQHTILHEVAHALAHQHFGMYGKGHGRVWKMFCHKLGIPSNRLHEGAAGERTVRKSVNWKLIIDTTGEVVGEYLRKPRFNVYESYIKGRKEETLHHLKLVNTKWQILKAKNPTH